MRVLSYSAAQRDYEAIQIIQPHHLTRDFEKLRKYLETEFWRSRFGWRHRRED